VFADPVFRPLVRFAQVGRSFWTVFPAKEALEAAARAIKANPRITHCGDPDCSRCNDAVRGGPLLDRPISK